MLAPWHYLSAWLNENDPLTFEAAHGKDIWSYAAEHPRDSDLINDAMACDARCPAAYHCRGVVFELFVGVNTVVDVGGGDRTTLRALVKAFPGSRASTSTFHMWVIGSPRKQWGLNTLEGTCLLETVPKANISFSRSIFPSNSLVQLKYFRT
ncbi:hypothetical protein IFM89_033120 [Coptis chinensis]|uniref:O-methyltransferase C-terminal domain-containing protein n=1 Tax=Coptis chinensis TaxID=261450 RepID=A0A835HIH6_9MAGN|nr:hypothetical protein IFM89_033120 [Coptis chinensis]